MHRPGYVQGGQEAKCGYLLLGIYYRRIPGDIVGDFTCCILCNTHIYKAIASRFR
jgi:hypothetical protein